MTFISQSTEQKILFLDLEGVVTKGMYGSAKSLSSRFHGDGTHYSAEAVRLIGRLVRQFGFKLVIISRHDVNNLDGLHERLDRAGINKQWLYEPDAYALPDDKHRKIEVVESWRLRNPEIQRKNTVIADDQPHLFADYENKKKYKDGIEIARVIGVDPEEAFSKENYDEILALFGIMPEMPAIARRAPAPQ